MKRVVRSMLVIAWSVLGCAGLGVIAGECWLAYRLDQSPGARPSVEFMEQNRFRVLSCHVPVEHPTTMETLDEQHRASGMGDLPAYVEMLMDCTTNTDARVRLIDVLRTAAAGGHAIAAVVLDRLARDPCARLSAIAGVPVEHRVVTEEVCRLSLPRVDGSINDIEGVTDVQTLTFRFAQLLALVEAGTAKPEAVAVLCADASMLPLEARVRLASAYPDLPQLLQRCGE